MEINCELIAEKYLLNRNPLYAFRFPISILIAIIIFGCAKAYKWSDNSYINQILIPVVALLLSMVLLDMISRVILSKSEVIRLAQLCKKWMHDPSVKNNTSLLEVIDMNIISQYNVENFTSNDQMQLQEQQQSLQLSQPAKISNNNNRNNNNVQDMIDEIPTFNPQPLQFQQYNSQCLEDSNCCNLCSGSPDENPCKVVAPIPGPQWMPQSANAVQNRLKNNNYTEAKCPIKG
jgi:phosphate/sulfate permease